MGGFFDARFLTAAVLMASLIFVNGWTDAPNSVATAIASGALRARTAIALSAAFNLLGVALAYAVNDSLSETIVESIGFSEGRLTVLCASVTAVVAFAVGAWYFGIPTSESHALIAALAGASFAAGQKSGVGKLLLSAGFGIIITTVFGFLLGYLFRKLLKAVKNEKLLISFQRLSSMALSLIHGAQDGQKFAAILLLALAAAAPEKAVPAVPAIVFTALLMSLGTAMGGGRIIKKVGQGITRVDAAGGLACDASAFLSLAFCTVFGIPASTTHTKTTAVMGVGVEGGIVNFRAFGEIAAAWVLTFPVCFLLSYAVTRFCL